MRLLLEAGAIRRRCSAHHDTHYILTRFASLAARSERALARSKSKADENTAVVRERERECLTRGLLVGPPLPQLARKPTSLDSRCWVQRMQPCSCRALWNQNFWSLHGTVINFDPADPLRDSHSCARILLRTQAAAFDAMSALEIPD